MTLKNYFNVDFSIDDGHGEGIASRADGLVMYLDVSSYPVLQTVLQWARGLTYPVQETMQQRRQPEPSRFMWQVRQPGTVSQAFIRVRI